MLNQLYVSYIQGYKVKNYKIKPCSLVYKMHFIKGTLWTKSVIFPLKFPDHCHLHTITLLTAAGTHFSMRTPS